jgi:hypothetical protein
MGKGRHYSGQILSTTVRLPLRPLFGRQKQHKLIIINVWLHMTTDYSKILWQNFGYISSNFLVRTITSPY